MERKKKAIGFGDIIGLVIDKVLVDVVLRQHKDLRIQYVLCKVGYFSLDISDSKKNILEIVKNNK